MNAVKPCPFCGGKTVTAYEGSTFRWVYVACDECGAQTGEVRRQTIGVTPEESWPVAVAKAIAEWNTRVDATQGARDE